MSVSFTADCARARWDRNAPASAAPPNSRALRRLETRGSSRVGSTIANSNSLFMSLRSLCGGRRDFAVEAVGEEAALGDDSRRGIEIHDMQHLVGGAVV